jgi:hypothetical protein
MELTPAEKQALRELKAQGKSFTEATAFISGQRYKKQSIVSRSIEKEQAANRSDKPFVNKAVEFAGLGGAVDVFGDAIARSPVANLIQSPGAKAVADEAGMTPQQLGQSQIEHPTGKQFAGAVAQTSALPLELAVGVASGGASIPAQAAIGGAFGYMYDVGTDLVDQKTTRETLTPGVATLLGVTAPPAISGMFKAFTPATRQSAIAGGEALVPAVTKQVSPLVTASREATEGLGDRVKDSGVVQLAGEFAERVPRAFNKAGEAIEDASARAKRIRNAPPAEQAAIKSGLNDQVINTVNLADDATREGYREIVELAGNSGETLGVSTRPEIVAGRAAGDQYKVIDDTRKGIGEQIGEITSQLSKEGSFDVSKAQGEMRTILANNGMEADKAGNLVFTAKNYTPEQQKVIQSLYTQATQATEFTPRQIWEFDQLFSKLQRQSRVIEKVDDVFITVPVEGGTKDVNIFKVFRDIYSKQLDEVAPEIKDLNKQYAVIRNLTDDIESSIVKGGNFNSTNVDPSEFAQTNLRRIFSDAQSAADYRAIYDTMDEMSRSMGYAGARADDLSAFATEMRKLYPESIPQTSFQGGIRNSILDAAGKIMDFGKADIKDQQDALRGLLEMGEATPASSVAPTATADDLFEPKNKIELALEKANLQRGSFSFGDSTNSKLQSNLPQRPLSPKGVTVVGKFLAHMDGTTKLSGAELANVKRQVQIIADKAGLKAAEGTDNALAKELADRYTKQIGSFNSGAKPAKLEAGETESQIVKRQDVSSDNLTTEAKKYKSADEFIGIRVHKKRRV